MKITSACKDSDTHSDYATIKYVQPSSVSVKDEKVQLPSKYTVHQNYPNPFNPVTTLRYDLPEQAQVTLTIYDILGRRARTLVDGVKPSGFHKALWDGRNELGESVGAGVYLSRIQAGDFTQTRKMLLLK